jgi:DNA repair protein RadC
MNDSQLKQEELLQILLHAYDKGEKTIDITTNELLEDLISQIKKVYAS